MLKLAINIKLFLVFAVLLISAPNLIHSQEIKSNKTQVINGVKYYMHTVAKGQTLYAIAKLYDRTVNDIVIENTDAIDGIKPGQILKIPVDKIKAQEKTSVVTTTNSVASDTAGFVMHKVIAGETLFAIAKQYVVTVEKLKALNPELADGLKAGQWIKIQQRIAAKKEITETKSTTLKKDVTAVQVQKVEPKIEKVIVEEKEEIIEKINFTGKKKDTYNIALFLPFHANEAARIDKEKLLQFEEQLSNKSTIAIQFYEGALIAIDSLKKQNIDAKIFVFDVDDTDSAKIETILKKSELAQMDLFIGPLYGSSFTPFAKYAKAKAIPIVAPFMQVNKILFNNPYVCKLSPSSALQLEQMAHFAVDSFAKQNIILVDNGNAKEYAFFNSFRTTSNEELQKKGFAENDTIKIAKGFNGVQAMLNSSKTNVVVLPSNNQSYVTEFLGRLNVQRDKYKIVLFGMQNWPSFDNIDLDYFNNLNTHLPSNTFVDYQNETTKKFIRNYRERFKTEPETYSYQGFDATYFFISELKKNGTGFLKNITSDKYIGLITNYNLMQYPAESGFENKYVNILQYKDYQLIKAK